MSMTLKQGKPCQNRCWGNLPAALAAEPVSCFPAASVHMAFLCGTKWRSLLQTYCFGPVCLSAGLPQLRWHSWNTNSTPDTLRGHKRGTGAQLERVGLCWKKPVSSKPLFLQKNGTSGLTTGKEIKDSQTVQYENHDRQKGHWPSLGLRFKVLPLQPLSPAIISRLTLGL